MAIWNPAQYLKFKDHRLRAALDLLARVPIDDARSVYDLGCGPGNVTPFLKQRWPAARVTGVDGSPEMLAKARAQHPSLAWVEADLSDWAPPEPADVLYSNAALQWLDDHATLFPRLLGRLRPGGALAIQMPRNYGEPSHTCILKAADAGPWGAKLKPHVREMPVAAPAEYYDIFAPVAAALDIWETVYEHPLAGDNPVVEWTKGSVLKPLLDVLDGADRDGFAAAYARCIKASYPKRADGMTVFPFRRLFIVAVR
ncbi:MAG: trans-aconitate 2-methyltransferase [Rhodospirillales bacterium]|nr:trans-aconitate 2-methyltransferase [Rhodospirillales bacterium]